MVTVCLHTQGGPWKEETWGGLRGKVRGFQLNPSHNPGPVRYLISKVAPFVLLELLHANVC